MLSAVAPKLDGHRPSSYHQTMTEPKSDAPTTPTPPRRRRFWKWFVIVTVGLPALLCVGLPLGWWAWNWRFSGQVDSELERIRASGEPVTTEELEAYYALPDGVEDRTSLWMEAFETLSKIDWKLHADLPIVGESQEPVPPPGQPRPQERAARALLAEYAESLRLCHQATAPGGSARFPTNYTLGSDMAMDHLYGVRAAARLLLLESHIRARQGDASGAFESLTAALRVDHALYYEPSLQTQLVRVRMRGMGQRQLELLLTSAHFSDKELLEIKEELASTNWQESLARGIRGDRVIISRHYRGELGDGIARQELPFVATALPRDEEFLWYLGSMRRAIDATREPPWLMRRRIEELEEELLGFGHEGKLKQFRFMLTLLVTSPLNAFTTGHMMGMAFDRTAEAAIAAELFHRRHGRMPASLDELVPEFLPKVPLDPYDGQPLRSVARDGSLVIYSIGHNSTDDDGHRADDIDEGDLTFVLK